ncbi:hypothetical protein [Actinomadura sp. 6N118]|uniref:hypothetical protein n=1 Tax=Actinomadura sp. 6N118 TaxID=3375151 RepID=UPI00379CE247
MKSTAFTIGLVLAALLGIGDLATGALDGPPPEVVVITTILGVVTLAGVVHAWRGGRAGLWAVVVTRALSGLGAVPGLLVDDTTGAVKGVIVVGLVLTFVTLALIVPGLRRAPASSAAA